MRGVKLLLPSLIFRTCSLHQTEWVGGSKQARREASERAAEMAVGEGKEKGVGVRELEKEQEMKQKVEGYKADLRGQRRKIRRVKTPKGEGSKRGGKTQSSNGIQIIFIKTNG